MRVYYDRDADLKLIENKKIEWNKYCAEVTSFELEKYLPVL